METKEQNEYKANDADAIVGEIFSGGITVAEAIERLRTRLLDLTSRNRLLKYRHPKGRCVQIADKPNINLVFNRLYADGKGVPFRYVPEPSPDTYEGKRPDAKLHAARLGISTSYEFAPNSEGSHGHRLHSIQTLLYPAELERQLRKLASAAKTAVEETGTNMLFLVFGFLEFYDRDDSELPMLAPLLSLPVVLIRGEIDKETRTYSYSVSYSGEDLAENHTLREKLRRDHMLSLPEFGEEDELETYFSHIENAVRNKRRWKVRRQITLGMLSFGKLAIWSDLDTKNKPGLLDHELIKSVFSGGSGGGGDGFHAEDYRIDEQPEASQSLIYDADSSQHSAIIDILSGKNMVVNGPPGTGKSQTITNVIAAALSKGKKILFVSEKLAALQVVRHRLNKAGLGHFCLEFHSHKTQKKKFLEDIQSRIATRFPAPARFQGKLATLQQQKTTLARHAQLLGSKIGNCLGLTVHEVFWAAERHRQNLGDLAAVVHAIGYPDASNWTYDDIQSRRARLVELAELYDAIGRFDMKHAWWGFQPNPIAPADDQAISAIIRKALERARAANLAANAAVSFFGIGGQPDAAVAGMVRTTLDRVPTVPDGADPPLLLRMFEPESDPKGQSSSRLLSDICTGVTKARGLFASAAQVLADSERPHPEQATKIESTASGRLSAQLLSSELGDALQQTARLEKALETFSAASRDTAAPYGPPDRALLDTFLANRPKAAALGLAPFTIRSIAGQAAMVLDAVRCLSEALARVSAIAEHRGLPFDSTPDSVSRLADPSGLQGIRRETIVDAKTLEEARRLARFPLSDTSVLNIHRTKTLMEAEISACAGALAHCRATVERLGIAFDSTERGVAEAAALAKIAAAAPEDLLEYRRPTFGRARIAELVEEIRSSIVEDQKWRTTLDRLFYLDALPPLAEINSAVATLRRRGGFFAFLDREWRSARRLHARLSKVKRKISGKQRLEELTSLATWIDARAAFVSDPESNESLGGLFRGLDTDPNKISRLNDWYLAARATLVECPGLSDKVDLSTLASERILELATKVPIVLADAERLAGLEAFMRGILGGNVVGFREAKANRWEDGLKFLGRAVECLGTVAEFFAKRADWKLSPKDALRLMEARAELDKAAPDLALLLRGEKVVREAGGDELGRLANLAGGRWSEAIPSISAEALFAAETASQARSFASENSPLSAAAAFAAAKAGLDDAWGAVAPLPSWNRFDGWQALAEAAQADAGTAREILEWLAPYAKTGVSAADLFRAFAEKSEAWGMLSRLAASADVQRMLGDRFDGVNTDLDSLSQTHGWGEAVCALDLPTSVCRSLLSGDARNTLETARRLYGEIDAGCRDAKKILEDLISYGSFSWDEWQRQVRSSVSIDLPSEIRSRLESADETPGSVLHWSKYLSLRQQCMQEGLADLVPALESAKIPSAKLASAFELAAYQSVGRSIYKAYPELSRFNGSAHEKTRAEYRALDAEIILLTGQEFANQIEKRTRVPEGQRGITVGDYTELQLLRREINKQRRHIPIRQLVKRAGRALQALKPCFMMGPLSVAQYLEQGTVQFDLVVMDEASQLKPEEALGAIARGSQLVVVGDPKQLPPTSFFDRMLDSGDDEEEDEAPAAIIGMESILDICQQLFTPVRSLRWHYRSQHESLIEFSNHYFYKNLIVFPSPYAKKLGLGVKYRYVKGGSYRDRKNVPEAQRVVDAVLEHMIKHSDESLGVVTLNLSQRELIEELLDRKLKTFAEGADFLGRWEKEGWPFFIKNLENVQGDERDVIYISTTFGKAPGTDKVRQNFGPISRPDGWRRLNVLFTRSKRRIELFTSMAPEDIVVDERTPLGTKALRDYLDFAKRGVLVKTDEAERDPDSDFEVAVANVVTSLGYEVKPQLGVAGFFIDIAVRNPDRPGEFLAGIECDGATYHSGFSVRDRDRIRQEILESLGWKGRIHRIWSTDWFFNPRKEIERLRDFLAERRRLSMKMDSAGWEKDDDSDAVEPQQTAEAIEELAEVLSETTAGEDLFVEVGDRIIYCFVDTPNDRHSVQIVDSASNAKMGIINEHTPVAQTLLGLSPGDVGDLDVAGQKTRQLRVIKIQRQGELLL
jgi:transcription elongation GreA/GreB family factor